MKIYMTTECYSGNVSLLTCPQRFAHMVAHFALLGNFITTFAKSDLCFGTVIHFLETFFLFTARDGLKPVVPEMKPKAS